MRGSEEKETQLLMRWLNEEKHLDLEVRLMDLVMRCYYSCIPQFCMVKGVLYYKWLYNFSSRF